MYCYRQPVQEALAVHMGHPTRYTVGQVAPRVRARVRARARARARGRARARARVWVSGRVGVRRKVEGTTDVLTMGGGWPSASG